jgi:uncharacterized protein YndB with AHSA1/START domain
MSDPRSARAVADLGEGVVLASVVLAATPERVFDALISDEVTRWWVNPGVFDTREWAGDVRPGGRWTATGVGGGRPYVLEGEFLEVDRPRRLVHTWQLSGAPGAATTITYTVEAEGEGTRLTLRQERFASRENCLATAIGWETSFAELARMLAPGG